MVFFILFIRLNIALPAIGAAFGAISSGPMLSSFTIR